MAFYIVTQDGKMAHDDLYCEVNVIVILVEPLEKVFYLEEPTQIRSVSLQSVRDEASWTPISVARKLPTRSLLASHGGYSGRNFI